MPKTWVEKRNVNKEPKLVKLEASFADIPAESMMLVATPKLVDEYIKQIPKGSQVDLKTLRKDLAAEFHADHACPLSTAIFVRISAEAAFEELNKGKPLSDITPFWRVIAPGSKMAAKLACGEKFLQDQLNLEKA